MLKRTLMCTTPVYLSLRNQQLVLTFKEDPEKATTIPIEDVGMVILEHQQAIATLPALNALTEGGVQVVLCNAKGMPSSLLQSFTGNNLQGETLRHQLSCGEVLKKQLWKQIIESKIRNQAALLKKKNKDSDALRPFYSNVKSGDSDNREGIAARIYFQQLFGNDFLRDREESGINSLLNYGYSVLRAAVSRAIVSSGLFPALGIFHHNRSNPFPLADDLMEPYRPFVDEAVYDMFLEGKIELNKETKSSLVMVLYADIKFEKVTRPMSVGLSITTASLAKCYSKESSTLSLPRFP